MQWFRWYHGTCSDPKLGSVARKVGATRERVIAVWAMILESASEAQDRGRFTVDPDGIADCLNCDTASIAAIMEEMAARGMLSDGTVAAFESRNPPRDDSAERVRRHRERKREATVTPVTRYSDAPVTPPEEEEDVDVESSSVLKLHARDEVEDQANGIIRLANRGMTENPSIGASCNPIPTGHGSRATVLEWLRDGIPAALAGSVVLERAREYQPDGRRRQITTMRYFDGAVRDAADRLKARETATPIWEEPAPTAAAPVPDTAPPEVREWAERLAARMEADAAAANWLESTTQHLWKANGDDREFSRLGRPAQEAHIRLRLLNAYGQRVGDPMPGGRRVVGVR